MSFEVRSAQSDRDYHQARQLVLAYVEWLNIDLSYQQFDQELEQFRQTYGPPNGGMVLAYQEQNAVGCVAVRFLEPQVAELKRMYLLEQFRARGLGRLLLLEALQIAKKLGYHKIRLDTLPTMPAAVHLYREAGFYTIAPYRFNPNPATIFMERDLLH